MSRKPVPYATLIRIARELSTAYVALETATALAHAVRGPRSIPVQRGLKAMLATDAVRASIEPLLNAWVTGDMSMRVLYGHAAIAPPAPDEDGE